MTPELQIDALADDPAEQSALRKFALIVGLVFGGIASGIAGAGYAFALDKRIATLEQESVGLGPVLKQIDKKLDALCRATPQAQCPLGKEE
jgi:uncharacterized protein (DUF697 family)